MPELTNRLKFAFPEEFQDGWFSLFKSFANELDFSIFNTLGDRNLVVWGGGTFSFSGNILSWNTDLYIKNFVIDVIYKVGPASVTLGDGQGLFAVLNRAPLGEGESPIRITNVEVKTLLTISEGVKLDPYVLIAMRFGDRVVFRNGRILVSGSTLDVFSGATGVGGGGGAGINVVDDNLSGQVDGTRTLFNTTLAFVVPKVALYLNGQRLTYGVDFTAPNNHSVQLVFAPVLGDKLIANYIVEGSAASDFIWEENLTTQVNGTNKIFTVSENIKVPNLSVYLNGLRQVMFEDWNFVVGQPKKFEFATAPLVGDVVVVQYIKE
jgi:hypothetical protein